MSVQTNAQPESTALELRVRLPLARFELAVQIELTKPCSAIFGPSGAGKSTLLRTLAGLERRARGRISLGEECWLDSERGIQLRPEQRQVGYVPQDGLLFPHCDVRANLLAGTRRARRNLPDPAATFATVCDLLELSTLLDRRVDRLSGGERQRVALGRAICSGPRLLLLDEPLAALDLPLRRRALPLLRRIRDQLRIPIVLVSHDPVEVQALCDEVFVLDAGQILANGPAQRVLTDPRVFPLVRDVGFENVLPATLVESAAGQARLSLGARGTGPRLLTTSAHGQKGDSLWVGIAARDVILSTECPNNISARNVLPARIQAGQAAGDLHLVTVEFGDQALQLTVEVTPGTVEELGLVPGKAVFVIVKAASCRLYEARGRTS
nr:molybdenum import ATP-binding protein ModC-like [Nerophis lumbriciformis]